MAGSKSPLLVEEVSQHHDWSHRESFLCRKCRNLIREAFYAPLKEMGFPKIQPLTWEHDEFGTSLLVAFGRGVIVHGVRQGDMVGDEVSVGGSGQYLNPFVYVGLRDWGQLKDLSELRPDIVISNALFWR